MLTVERTVPAPVDAVWRVLADGWSYANWVVGASRIRDVESAWPAVGSSIHHSAGVWPLLLNDTTTVLESDGASRLLLKARGWPAGEAHVQVILEAQAGGTRVIMSEDVVAGPGKLIPKPVRDAVLLPRNRESLFRLELIAVNREKPA